MNLVMRGLVLRSTDYKEADKILTVLTDMRGVVTVAVRGARRRGSRLQTASQLFTCSEMTLFDYQGRYKLDDAEVLETFSGLQKDLPRLALASYIAEVLGAEAEESGAGDGPLRLALNSLYALARGISTPTVVKPAFELRYMALSGYAPALDACAVCSAETPVSPMLSLDAGVVHCAHCPAPGGGRSLPLDGASLSAMRYILGCDLKKLFAYLLPESSKLLLDQACEAYLLSREERRFRTLEFYKSAGELT
ncbi:MAG: DNA repair protein RecO [Clostridiaceae bacterium]|nr:DNA repair protein RecO [Clostridiaceae bacterium]